MVFGNVSSACLSLKVRRRLAGGGSETSDGAGFTASRPSRFGGCAGQIRAALRQHVAIAAGIFDPAALPSGTITPRTRRSRKSRSWLMSSTVPGYSAKHVLENVQRFHIEIVGRLVEHQEI